MRRAALALVILTALALGGGCDRDHRVECAQAYDHLVTIAKRYPNAKLRDEFVGACVGAFDEGRHLCLMTARTVEQALECRPTKVQPG